MTPVELQTWMTLALQEAKLAGQADEVPIAAILVSQGKVIGRGRNLRETSHRTIAHAEILAIEDYCLQHQSWRLPPDTTLFVTAEPCIMCAGALIWARVDHIVYGCEDTKNAGLRNLMPLIESGRFDHKIKSIQSGILESECRTLLSEFFKKKRKS